MLAASLSREVAGQLGNLAVVDMAAEVGMPAVEGSLAVVDILAVAGSPAVLGRLAALGILAVVDIPPAAADIPEVQAAASLKLQHFLVDEQFHGFGVCGGGRRDSSSSRRCTAQSNPRRKPQ